PPDHTYAEDGVYSIRAEGALARGAHYGSEIMRVDSAKMVSSRDAWGHLGIRARQVVGVWGHPFLPPLPSLPPLVKLISTLVERIKATRRRSLRFHKVHDCALHVVVAFRFVGDLGSHAGRNDHDTVVRS